MSFMDTSSAGTSTPAVKETWIENVGTYKYYALILSKFNPVVAMDIFDNPAHVIAEAYVSMKCYEWSPKQDKHGR